MDIHGNVNASEGCDRCYCGGKYWENDYCVACGISYERDWLRHFGTSSLTAAQQVLDWNLDALRVKTGQVEIVTPEVDLRRTLRRGQKPTMPDMSVRVVIQEGYVMFVKDVI